eukprot:1469238-Amphidinium_carterae.1
MSRGQPACELQALEKRLPERELLVLRPPPAAVAQSHAPEETHGNSMGIIGMFSNQRRAVPLRLSVCSVVFTTTKR